MSDTSTNIMTGATLPATCVAGDLFLLVSASDPQSTLYTCTATNVWTQVATSPRITLPDAITAVVGDTLQVYLCGMLEAQTPYAHPHRVTCSVGKAYPRYFELAPTAGQVGTYTLTVSLLDHGGFVAASDTTSIVVVNPTGAPASEKIIMCMGDSITADGVWVTELSRRLKGSGGSPAGLGYTNLTFAGTEGTDPKYVGYAGWTWATYVGTSRTGAWVTATHDKTSADRHSYWLDGSGQTWLIEEIEATRLKMIPYGVFTMPAAPGTLTYVSGGTHTAAINYTLVENEPATPFWDAGAGELSIEAWATPAGYATIDAVYAFLGWNGLPGANYYAASQHSTQMATVRTFLDVLHAEYPSAVMRIVGLPPPADQGGLAASYGAVNNAYANYYQLLRTVNGLNRAYQDLCNEAAYSSFCRFLMCTMDAEYNYPTLTKAVNVRNAATETLDTNDVHPATAGKYQIADVVFRDVIRTFCSS
jgi:hypothetical protein